MRVHLAWDCIDTVESSSRTMNIYMFSYAIGTEQWTYFKSIDAKMYDGVNLHKVSIRRRDLMQFHSLFWTR